MNSSVLIGRLARDVDLKFMPSGVAVVRLTLAVNKEMTKEQRDNALAQSKPTADFIPINVYGKQAENCAKFLGKGSQIAVQGKITTGSYTTQTGEKRYTMEVTASRVMFLNNAQSTNNTTLPGKPQVTDTNFFDTFDTEDGQLFEHDSVFEDDEEEDLNL